MLPLPLTYQIMTDDGHKKAVTVGYITDMFYDESHQVNYTGTFADPTLEPYVDKVIGGIAEGWIKGVSVDVDSAEYELPPIPDEFESAEQVMDLINNPPMQVMSSGRIAGLCVVTIPAFQEAYIALGSCDCPDETQMPADQTVPDVPSPDDEDDLDPIIASARFRHGLMEIVDSDESVMEFAGAVGDHRGNRTWASEEDLVEAVVAAAFAPGTHDGPGWITHPVATNRIRKYWVHGKGAAKIGWGAPNDFYRCRSQLRKYVANPEWLSGLCANMHKEALGVWPGQEDGGRKGGGLIKKAITASGEDIDMTIAAPYRLVASAAPDVPPAEWFTDPGLNGPTAFTVTDEGRVFGHVATWNVCHIGMQGKCTTAPRSISNYAYYRSGALRTTAGDVSVGHITMGTGHAGLRETPYSAAAHYDNTGSVVADVAAGEDAYGIWVSGALRPDATDAQKRSLKAAALSGDWRTIGGSKEMIAALAVNVPGFPIPRTEVLVASGEEALVAAAVVQHAGQEEFIEAESGVNVVVATEMDPKVFAAQVVEHMDRIAAAKEARHAYAVATRDDVLAAALEALNG